MNAGLPDPDLTGSARVVDLSEPSRIGATERVVPQPFSDPAHRLTRLAARLLGATYAQVSLLTRQQIVASSFGRTVVAEERESPLEESLCTVTVRSGQPLRVTDAVSDHRVQDLPPVRSGLLRSYLGVPLRTADGFVVGSLCVFDPAPREWSPDDAALLEDLAEVVSSTLEHAAVSAELETSSARLALGYAAAEIGSFDWDFATGRVEWDDRLKTLLGYAGDEPATIDFFWSRVHPDDRERVTSAIDSAVRSRGEFAAEYRVVRPGEDDVRWIHARGRVLRDARDQPVRMLGAAYDSTSAHDGQARVARVLETMSTAFFSVDGDWRVTYLNREGERVLGRAREEIVGEVLWDLFPEAVGSRFWDEYHRAVTTGEPVAFEEYYPPLDTWFEVRAWPGQDGLAVYFYDITARREAEAQRVEALARAEQAGERLRVIADASARLSATLEPQEVVRTLGEIVLPAYGDWVVVALRSDVAPAVTGRAQPGGPGDVEVVYVVDHDPLRAPVLEQLVRSLPLSVGDLYGVGHVVATGESEWLPEIPDDVLAALAPDDETLARMRELRVGAALTVPLSSRGRTLGAVTFGEPAATPLDRTLLEDLVLRAGSALDNAISYGTERRLGLTLQRALLPHELPRLPGVELAARYLPGTSGAEIGGDFYDARVRSDGRLSLVVGDVMGRGMHAAARMAQLRAVAAWVAHDVVAPDAVLARLAAEADQLIDLQLATVLVALYDPESRELTVASAGHPSPLLAVGESAGFLGVDPGPPIGAGPGEFPSLVVPVPPGATLVLFTDGLVEERGESISDGMERLRVAACHAPPSAEQACDHLLHEVGRDHGVDDDVALLVLRHFA